MGDLDMMDPIFFGEVPRCSYKCGTIDSDDSATPPHRQRISSKYESLSGLLIFLLEWGWPLSP